MTLTQIKQNQQLRRSSLKKEPTAPVDAAVILFSFIFLVILGFVCFLGVSAGIIHITQKENRDLVINASN